MTPYVIDVADVSIRCPHDFFDGDRMQTIFMNEFSSQEGQKMFHNYTVRICIISEVLQMENCSMETKANQRRSRVYSNYSGISQLIIAFTQALTSVIPGKSRPHAWQKEEAITML